MSHEMSTTTTNICLTLFFTYDVSLKTWAKSGLLQREIRLYQELQNRGVEVQFLTYGDTSDRQWESELGNIRLLPIYERLPRPKNKLLRLLQTAFIPWVFRHDLQRSDLFKTNQIWGSWVAVLAKWIFSKPLLARGGYEAYRNALQNQQHPLKLGLLRWTSWITYHNADHVWLSTIEICDFVQKTFGVPQNKMTVWPNWIDIQRFAPAADQATRSEHRILFVGRLSEEKNIPLLLKALEGTDYTVDIIGDGMLREKLEQEARQSRVKAHFLGSVPNNQLPEFYNAHSVYVLCSRYEGNPKTLLEAMSCGCAVIGTDVPGIREVIQHEQGGLLISENPDDLRTTIEQLFRDDTLRKKLGNNARQQILEQNSLDAAVRQEICVYHHLTI